MYICICENINEKKIIDSIKNGKNKKEIIEYYKIGMNCGKCKNIFNEKYNELKKSKN